MIIDALKQWLPEKFIPWLILGLLVLWIGWTSNSVYGLMEKHIDDMSKTYRYAQVTCYAVAILAKMDPEKCERM